MATKKRFAEKCLYCGRPKGKIDEKVRIWICSSCVHTILQLKGESEMRDRLLKGRGTEKDLKVLFDMK